MTAEVKAEHAGPEGAVLVLHLVHPPANALTAAVRAALMAALASAPPARGVVIAAEGRQFAAAASIDLPPGDAELHPTLAELCAALDAAPVPVVAALRGIALGPGAELALAAHGRVAAADLRFSLPEVVLGLPPSSGATQRLPRLVGATEALDILLRAPRLSAEQALAIGLVDQVVEGDPLPAAVELALALGGPRPASLRTEGLSDVPGFAAAVAQARAEARRSPLPAPARIVDCVEAALYLPFANGLALEAVSHDDLSQGPEARGLIAAARSERRAAVLPEPVQRAQGRVVSHLGLSGAGPVQAALALMALGQGLRVSWTDADPARMAAALSWLTARMEDEVRAGRMTALQRDADRARLAVVPGAQALSGAGLVVHGAADAGFAALLRAMPQVPQLVAGGAEGAMGLVLAPNGRVAELALPETARPDQIATAVAMLRLLGAAPVLTGRMPLIGRRMAGAGKAALTRLAESGVPRRVMAAAMERFGHALPELPDTAASLREMSPDEVTKRWLAALANEGLRLLDARVARRPADIDYLMVQGHGFPRRRGGPMFQAADRGPMVLRVDMRRWAEEDDFWAPHPLMDRLFAHGRRLSDLDAG